MRDCLEQQAASHEQPGHGQDGIGPSQAKEQAQQAVAERADELKATRAHEQGLAAKEKKIRTDVLGFDADLREVVLAAASREHAGKVESAASNIAEAVRLRRRKF